MVASNLPMLPDSRSASFLGLSTLSLFDVLLEDFREYCQDDSSDFFVDLRLASCNSFPRNFNIFLRRLSD